MRRTAMVGLVSFILGSSAGGATDGAWMPVKFSDVEITGDFWRTRQEVNRNVSIPHNLDTCESTGRIRNFAQAAGIDQTPYHGHYFHDSDVFKVLEAVAYSLATHPDPALETRLDAIIDLVARSQQPDGYLNTWFTLQEPGQRWRNIGLKHELYCAGHLFEAAVAHFHATGKRTFLDVACRLADHIDRTFGPGIRHVVPGHEEIELALIKLWRATGERRYLDLARFFVYEHGQSESHELLGSYCQDHRPIGDQNEPVGHAVRWLYLFSAVADLAALDGDQALIDAMERLWQNIVTRKMYVTGGVGEKHHSEGFARDYFLPNEDAYCETCASIGMAFWNHRLALLHGDGRFADLVERVLYNGALSGVSLDGKKFFYVNPLASNGDHHRAPWYGCACCPTNVVRFVAALGDFVYGRGANGVSVLQYVGGSSDVALDEGRVKLVQETRYPWDGRVRITVEPDGVQRFAIRLRVPGWCHGAKAAVNGDPVRRPPQRGFVTIDRSWKMGDVIDLDLPMPVRRIAAQPKVDANVGRLALARGPIVYCFEETDNSCPLDRVAIAGDAPVESRFEAGLLGGVQTLSVQAVRERLVGPAGERHREGGAAVQLKAIPYYAWDNRKPGRMIVWMPTELRSRDSAATTSTSNLR